MGMTLTSGLLLLLEPGPVAPISGVTLQSVDRATEPTERLFATTQPKQWLSIVIHDSGSLKGSSESLNALHEKAGLGGLGYHFVLNNGSDRADGLIEVGFRWQRQFNGNYVQGPGSEWFNNNAIGICLVGDADRRDFTEAQFRELVWLVQQLQAKFDIPSEAVFVEVGSGGTGAARFPYAKFRGQLLSPRTP